MRARTTRVGGGPHLEPFLGRIGAGGDQLGLRPLADLHHAQPAGAVGRQPLHVAERRDREAEELRRLEQRRALLDVDVQPVDASALIMPLLLRGARLAGSLAFGLRELQVAPQAAPRLARGVFGRERQLHLGEAPRAAIRPASRGGRHPVGRLAAPRSASQPARRRPSGRRSSAGLRRAPRPAGSGRSSTAALLPAAMASTTVFGPVTTSPPANTPGPVRGERLGIDAAPCPTWSVSIRLAPATAMQSVSGLLADGDDQRVERHDVLGARRSGPAAAGRSRRARRARSGCTRRR